MKFKARNKSKRSNKLFFVAFILYFGVLATTIFFLFVDRITLSFSITRIVFALFLLIVISFLILWSSQKKDWIQPITLLGITIFLHFGLRALLIEIGGNFISLDRRLFNLGKNLYPFMELSLWYAFGGYLLAWIGYYVKLGKSIAERFPAILYNWDTPWVNFRISIVWFLGCIATVASILSGGVIYVNAMAGGNLSAVGALTFFSNLRTIGLLGAWILYYKNQKSSFIIIFCWISLLTEIILGIISGYRGSFLIIGFVLILSKIYGSERLPSWKIIIAVMASLFFASLFVSAFREVAHKYQNFIEPNQIISVVVEAWRLVWSGNATATTSKVVGSYANRFDLDNFLIILVYTPKIIPYLHGASWLPFIYSFIPRFLWPNRPEINLGFMDVYDPGPGRRIGGSPSTILGDFYRNFGPMGVFVGMLIVGVIIRFIYEWLIVRSKRSVAGIVIFCVLCISWINFAEMGLLEFLYTPILRILPITLIAVWFIQWPLTRGRHTFKSIISQGSEL